MIMIKAIITTGFFITVLMSVLKIPEDEPIQAGMLSGAIEPADGSKFLYAAQVAYGAMKRQPAAPQPAAQ